MAAIESGLLDVTPPAEFAIGAKKGLSTPPKLHVVNPQAAMGIPPSWHVQIDDILTNPPKNYEFLIEGILPAGVATILGAHGGVGKSILSLIIACHAAIGKSVMGLALVKAPVVYYSGEDEADIIRWRIDKICEWYEMDIKEVAKNLTVLANTDDPVLFGECDEWVSESYSKTVLSVTPAYKTLKAICEKVGARYIIIDNASDAFDGNENARREVRAFIRHVKNLGKKLKAASLIPVHVNRGSAMSGVKSSENYSGSTAWHNSARSRLFLSPPDDDNPHYILRHEKTNYGKLLPPIHLDMNEDGVFMHIEDEEAACVRDEIKRQRLEVIVSVIYDITFRGGIVPTAQTGTSTTFHAMSSHPKMPSGITSRELNKLIKEAEAALLIGRETYKNAQRKDATKFVVKQEPNSENS